MDPRSRFPGGWPLVPLRFLVQRRAVKGRADAELLSVYRDWGVVPKASRDDNFNREGSDLGAYLHVRRGDLVVNKMKAWQGSLAVSRHEGIVSPAYYVFQVDGRLDGGFLHHFLREPVLVQDLRRISAGVRPNQWDLSLEEFGKVQVPLPPLGVQRAIADFLDRKTAAIDALIEKKERLLALLAEKRAALIHRAVTKGLDPTVPMKDSGIPWIGEIPAHWKVTRLRYLCEIRTGSRDTQDAVEGGAYPFFVRSQTPERAETWSFDGEAVLTSGDGAGVGKIFHHVVGRIEVHQRVYIFSRFRGAAGRMVYYYLKALLARIVLEGTAKSTVDSIRRPMLTDFPVAIGSIPEQQKVVEFLDRMDQRLTKVESVVIGQVARLREYRQALITAAVTGQLVIDEVAA